MVAYALVVTNPHQQNLAKRAINSKKQTQRADIMASWQPQLSNVEVEGGPIEGGPDGVKGSENESHGGPRKKVVIVGLGMVGISFM